MNKFIGCSGWNYKDWRGKFYPDKLAQKNWLSYYAEHFSSVEVNNTFYRQPSEATLLKWFETVPDDFKFTLKANRFITHLKKLENVEDSIVLFEDAAALLEHKLGCILWQLPPSLHRNDARLRHFCKTLSSHNTNVIEFRHISWFHPEVYAILNEHNITLCTLSSSAFTDELILTSKVAYIRFHGTGPQMYNYYYSTEELLSWKKKISESGAAEIYAYFNNDIGAHAPKNAEELIGFFKNS